MTNKPATTPSSYATLPTEVTMFFRNEGKYVPESLGMGHGRTEMTAPKCYGFWEIDEEEYQKFRALPVYIRFFKETERRFPFSQETFGEYFCRHQSNHQEIKENLLKQFVRVNQEVVDGFAAIFPLAAELAKIDLYEVMGVGIGDAPKTDPVTYYDIKYDSRIALAAPGLNGYAYYAHPLDDSHDYAKKLELLTEYCAAMKDPKDLLHPYVTEMYQGLDKEQRLIAIQALDVLVGCRNLMILGQELMKPGVDQALNSQIPEVMRGPLKQFLANTSVAETAKIVGDVMAR